MVTVVICKNEILDHVCDVTKMHHKSAIRKFHKLQMNGGRATERRGRKTYYTYNVVLALKTVWFAASSVCGELVHQIIEEYVEIQQRDNLWEHSAEATEKLLKMSEATVKRRVTPFIQAKHPKKGVSCTNPSRIKEIIPLFTGPWKDKPAGFGQIDTVVHCGSSLVGDLAYSVNYTDVSTLWVSFCAQWNKGQHATQKV